MAVLTKRYNMLQKTVAVPGTAVPLTTDTRLRAQQFILQCNSSNTGAIYLGDSTVSSANGIRLEVPLDSYMDSALLPHDALELRQIYIDAEVAGDGVTVFYRI